MSAIHELAKDGAARASANVGHRVPPQMLFAPILFALEDGLGLTEDGLREQLAGQCKAAGSIAAWSREHGLCDEQVGAFIRGKRPPEPKLLTALGMTSQRFYRAAPL